MPENPEGADADADADADPSSGSDAGSGSGARADTGAAVGAAAGAGAIAGSIARSDAEPTVALRTGDTATVPLGEPGDGPHPTIPLLPAGTAVSAPTIPLLPAGTAVSATAPLPVRAGSRRRSGVAVACLAVLAVLAGGGALAYHFLAGPHPSGPEAAVTSYFADLSSGDATDAAALATGPYAATPVLAPQTLADPARRPSGLTIVSIRPLSTVTAQEYRSAGVDGRDLTLLTVKYTVHGAAQNDSFLAEQDPKTSDWKLVDPYRQIRIGGGWSATVTVDGASVGESRDIELFPGAHVVADPPSRDFTAESATVYPHTDTQSGAYAQTTFGDVTLPAPELSASGQAAAQAAYRRALDDCAVQAATGRGDCGIDDTYNGYTCNHVSWTVTSAAAVQVDLSARNSDGGFAMTASGSTASESGDYSDWIGFDHTFQDQQTDLEDSRGTVTFAPDGSATVNLDA